mmetsp:Transcript_7442/g.32822  ORF Transcript_7442/g.32822 Transcript_7442/m.32822 type:complete len:234 (+) Transcript_7442:554-1255(+)
MERGGDAVRQGARAPRLRPRRHPPRGHRLSVPHPGALRAVRPGAVPAARRARALRRRAQMFNPTRAGLVFVRRRRRRRRVRRRPGAAQRRVHVAHAHVRPGAAAQDGGAVGGGGGEGGGGVTKERVGGGRVRPAAAAAAASALARRGQGDATGDRPGAVAVASRADPARDGAREDADNRGEFAGGARRRREGARRRDKDRDEEAGEGRGGTGGYPEGGAALRHETPDARGTRG